VRRPGDCILSRLDEEVCCRLPHRFEHAVPPGCHRCRVSGDDGGLTEPGDEGRDRIDWCTVIPPEFEARIQSTLDDRPAD
jgi:hypothetical protein